MNLVVFDIVLLQPRKGAEALRNSCLQRLVPQQVSSLQAKCSFSPSPFSLSSRSSPFPPTLFHWSEGTLTPAELIPFGISAPVMPRHLPLTVSSRERIMQWTTSGILLTIGRSLSRSKLISMHRLPQNMNQAQKWPFAPWALLYPWWI